jgi:putative PIN family toxin of toxin-antitoxin system
MIQTSKKPVIVLDTNVLLVSIPSKSKYRWIFEKLINAEFEMCISNEILMEYEEIFRRKFSNEMVENILELLLTAGNVKKITPWYHWHLIDQDKDDNKFVDCAIASNADYIITNDRHFQVLKDVEFPKVDVLTVDDFKSLF